MSIHIQRHFCERGYDCLPGVEFGAVFLFVRLEIEGRDVQLVLLSEEPFTLMPEFYLLDPAKYGKLAHVTLFKLKDVTFGSICVNDRDSVSVNFSVPELAAEESLRRHIALLERVIKDPNWNEQELLREFYSNWLHRCAIDSEKPLLVSCADASLQRLDVYSPANGVKYGIGSHYLVEPVDAALSPISELRYSAKNAKRAVAGKAVVVPIETLKPAPNQDESLENWYIEAIEGVSEATKKSLRQIYGQWRDKEYWVIFTAITVSSERTWFAIKLNCDAKKALPTTREKLESWKIKPLAVRMFSHENVVRRGGGITALRNKRVALAGAGSVGCEIAHKLSAAGVSDLTIFDNDCYSMDNLYRHILPEYFVGQLKSLALAYQLHTQFPWSHASWSKSKLLDIQKNSLSHYDLIIIAIGRPTHERLFKQYLLDHGIEVSVINCWLEGFGIGGHAVLDIPESKGCLFCSYVCLESGKRGLSSNLSFIEQNQSVAKNIAGCGEQFISYGAVCSAQTAIMATDLAIKFLEGKVTESCKMSWKGDDTDANEEGVRLTHRYYCFDKSLKRLPLLDEDCDVCNG